MRPASQYLADAVRDALTDTTTWLYVPDTEPGVAVVDTLDNLPLEWFRNRSLLDALADAYDSLAAPPVYHPSRWRQHPVTPTGAP